MKPAITVTHKLAFPPVLVSSFCSLRVNNYREEDLGTIGSSGVVFWLLFLNNGHYHQKASVMPSQSVHLYMFVLSRGFDDTVPYNLNHQVT